MSALVLVVEKPGAYRDALVQALAARGARTDARDDAMEALAVAASLAPNVVLVSDHAGPPDPQSVCRVLQRKLADATVYRLGDPDFSDPLAKHARVLPRLSDADAIAEALLDPNAAKAQAPSAVEWERKLEAWQLPALLLGMCERRNTGYLVLHGAGVEREITLVRGLPVAARSTVLEERLGPVLLEANLVAGPELERALDSARRNGQRLGEALLLAGALDASKLCRGLALQLRERLLGACEGPAVQARFLREPDLGLHAPLFPFHPLAIALECARRVPASARDSGLARLSRESLVPGAHATEADAWLQALGVRDLNALLTRTDARGLCDALRATLLPPPDGEPAVEPSALVLALLWSGRIEARIASALPAVPSVPPPAQASASAGGWLRVLGAMRPVQLPAARAFVEPASDVERALEAYLLGRREQPLAQLRARQGALVDAIGESDELLRQWCRDEPSVARDTPREAAAALRAALDGASAGMSGEADPLAVRCRRALLRRRLEQLPVETRSERNSERAPRESMPATARRASRAAPPPPPPPRSPTPPPPDATAPAEDDQALFAAVEPLLHQGNWQGVIELLSNRPADAPPLSARLNLLCAIALKEAPAAGTAGKQNADADLLGMRAVSALLRVAADSPTALIVGKRVLRKRQIEWQTSPPRRVSFVLTTIALLVGAAVGLLFNQRLIDLFWK